MLIRLFRYQETKFGTQGFLYVEDSFFHTLELPWKSNEPNVSCIPIGTYKVSIEETNRRIAGRKRLPYLHDVKGRSGILIHAGNFAGDRSLGLNTDVYGCILLGKKLGFLHNQLAILNSRLAMSEFLDLVPEEFELRILP